MTSHHHDTEWQNFALLPTVDGHSGHAFFSAQTSAGRLMILQKGAAAIVKEAIEIAGRSNPDAVFGELFTRRDWIGNLATCEPSDFRAVQRIYHPAHFSYYRIGATARGFELRRSTE
jgi:hypothetical protein